MPEDYVRNSWIPMSPVSESYWNRENSRVGRMVNDTWDAIKRGAARVQMELGGASARERDLYKVTTQSMKREKNSSRMEADATVEPVRFRLHVREDGAVRVEPTFKAPEPAPQRPTLEQAYERFTQQYDAATMRVAPDERTANHYRANRETLYGFMAETKRAIQDGDRVVDLANVQGADTPLGRDWSKWLRESGIEVQEPVRKQEPALERVAAEVQQAFVESRERYSSSNPNAKEHMGEPETLHTIREELGRAARSTDRTVDVANIKGAETAVGREWVERLSDAGVTLRDGLTDHIPKSAPPLDTAERGKLNERMDTERTAYMSKSEARPSFWKDDRREQARAAAQSQGKSAPDAGVVVQQRQMRA
jgi:hypothetical protein